MERYMFKTVLWATIEDYAGLYSLIWELNSLLPEEYELLPKEYEIINLAPARNILSFYLEEDYVSLFYNKWCTTNFELKEIPKEKALKLILEDSCWTAPSNTDIYITASATQKGEDLYNSGEVMNENFKVPEIF